MQITHHLIDVVEPTQRFTVADWLEQADTLITQIQASGGCPIVVGGTNLYIKALLEGIFNGPTIDPDFRDQLEDRTQATSCTNACKRLTTEAAQRLHPNDRKRIDPRPRGVSRYRTAHQSTPTPMGPTVH